MARHRFINNPVIEHFHRCDPHYPEKPAGEAPQHTVVMEEQDGPGDGWVALICADCGAMATWKPTHRHWKGGLYEVLHQGTFEHTMAPVVIYRGQDGQVWVRFEDDFNWRGEGVRRFTQL
jgi:hypothetical protein